MRLCAGTATARRRTHDRCIGDSKRCVFANATGKQGLHLLTAGTAFAVTLQMRGISQIRCRSLHAVDYLVLHLVFAKMSKSNKVCSSAKAEVSWSELDGRDLASVRGDVTMQLCWIVHK